MATTLGLDIGSNSVGSAWVGTDQRIIQLGVSVFPAGVDETDTKRGAPVNQKRRQARSLRRSLARRSARKRGLCRLLTDAGLLPGSPQELKVLVDRNPWILRRDALERKLAPHEFGRVLVHLNQRRGALGVETDPDNSEEGKVKEAIDNLESKLAGRTIGQFMADEMDARRTPITGSKAATCQGPIRNRRDSFEFHANRALVREEFEALWQKQRSLGGELAKLLTDELKRELDDPHDDDTWRHKGAIFGQRRTYWDTGTLGRCDLEPADHRCPIHDMYAQHFRVIETVNNIRIQERGEVEWQPLDQTQREVVVDFLRGKHVFPLRLPGFPKAPRAKKPVKGVKCQHIREMLGIDKKTLGKMDRSEKNYSLNIENDPEREINTDRFHRGIVLGVFGEEPWNAMTDNQRESVNRALLKFDKDADGHADRLQAGAQKWWGLDEHEAKKLVEAWKGRGRTDQRLNLSRRAIMNLVPHMQRYDEESEHWPTQIEARQMFAEDPNNGATPEQRIRYAHTVTDRLQDVLLSEVGGEVDQYERLLRLRGSSKADRHYAEKHPDLLPPAPTLANPVVRKAVHEVRRHVIAHIRAAGRRPDRIVIEFARGTKLTRKDRTAQLNANRKREKKRKKIEEELREWGIPESNWRRATLRVRLCEEQGGICPFSIDGPNASRPISPRMAAEGRDVEIEHIIPQGITGGTMDYNNLVLCFRNANRAKGMRTPLDWLDAEGLAKVLQRLEKQPIRRNKPKWKNLQKETPDADQYRNSQLTDTAYASRQVADYLRANLYGGETVGQRRIFTTKGEFTARLRADWGLHESEIDRANNLEAAIDPEKLRADPELAQALRRARKDPTKDRVDHRHHALDALVIALTGPEMLTKLGQAAREAREYRERTGDWPNREAMPPPWGTAEQFHRQAMDALNALVVAHRPVKRRIVGAFHKETLFGPVLGSENSFTNRIRVEALTPNHLREPRQETEREAIERLTRRYQRQGLSEENAKKQARVAVKAPDYVPRITDPPPEKSGIVRDRDLRRRLRACINEGLLALRIDRDAESFTASDVERLVAEHALRMPSGVPIKSVILLRTMKDPVVVARKAYDSQTGRMVPDPDPRTRRVYDGQNNHHIEIRENAKGTWAGKTITGFEAVGRNAARLQALKEAGVPPAEVLRRLSKSERAKFGPIMSRINAQHPIVDCSDNTDGRFIMSLAEGETIHMCRPTTGEPGYFVVFKLDKPQTIHFQHHWDARRAIGRKHDGKLVPGSNREDIHVSATDLKRKCSLDDDTPPCKVVVSPLGEIRERRDD